MKDLLKNVELQIEMFFDNKIKDANVPDEVFDEIWGFVSDAQESIEDILDDADKKIDDILEEHTKPEMPSFSESIALDQQARQEALYSIDNNYYLTR